MSCSLLARSDAVILTKKNSIVERLRDASINSVQTAMGSDIFGAAADKIEQLERVAQHLRNCRQCGEMDVSDCHEGAMMWRISMGEL